MESDQQSPTMKWWGSAGIVLGTVLSLLGVLSIANNVLVWASVSEPLHAVVSYGPCYVPEHFSKMYETVLKLIGAENLVEQAKGIDGLTADPSSNQERIDMGLTQLAMKLFEQIRNDKGPKRQLGAFYLVQLTNDGTSNLQDVQISVPGAHTAHLGIPGRPKESIDIDEVISLGKMTPKQESAIIAWTNAGPHSGIARDIVVTHSDGVGVVNIKLPAGPVGQFADAHIGKLLFSVFALAAASIVVILFRSAGLLSTKASQN